MTNVTPGVEPDNIADALTSYAQYSPILDNYAYSAVTPEIHRTLFKPTLGERSGRAVDDQARAPPD